MPEYIYSLEAETVLADAMMIVLREFFENHVLPIAKLEALIKDFSFALDLSHINEFIELIHDYSYPDLMDEIVHKPFWWIVYSSIERCYEKQDMGELLRIMVNVKDQIKKPYMASRGDSKSVIAEEN